MKPNKIIASAIRDSHTGKVFVGARHNHIINDMIEMHGYVPPVDREHHEQGFIDRLNQFHNRAQAATIAYNNGQILHPLRELHSEDLY